VTLMYGTFHASLAKIGIAQQRKAAFQFQLSNLSSLWNIKTCFSIILKINWFSQSRREKFLQKFKFQDHNLLSQHNILFIFVQT
jgi:hypothetical protein